MPIHIKNTIIRNSGTAISTDKDIEVVIEDSEISDIKRAVYEIRGTQLQITAPAGKLTLQMPANADLQSIQDLIAIYLANIGSKHQAEQAVEQSPTWKKLLQAGAEAASVMAFIAQTASMIIGSAH